MSNLLPREAQRAVWGMYRTRFVIASSLLGLAVAALSLLTLLPSYLALHNANGATNVSSTSDKDADAKDKAAVRRVQSLLGVLSPLVAASTTPTAAIARALSLRPSTIAIDHISYTTERDGGSIMLVGTAATREAINGYRQALTSEPLFVAVSIPVGDLTSAPGGRFSLNLFGDF